MCVSVVNTHEILKGEDGDVRVMGLAGDVSWSSAGLWAVVMAVWPTHSLLPCSSPPPPSPFPLFSHCANDLHAWDHSSCPIAEVECSLDEQQEPNSFKLLALPDSDFRGFHSWVDTDVLVSAVMGPLSFHANWSVRAELRGSQHREKENLYALFKAFLWKKNKVITHVHKITTYHNNDGHWSDKCPDEMVINPQPAPTGYKKRYSNHIQNH